MIAIFGGTFDPIHYGHLRTLWEVKEALQLDEVRLIPSFIPPHRDVPGATVEQRLTMLQLAIQDVPGFVVDERELNRGGASYMVDTLQSLRDELGDEPLCLILGMDAFLGLPNWHKWRRLNELAHLIVMHRPGSEVPTSGALAELVDSRVVKTTAELHGAPAGAVYFQAVSQLDISATKVRSLCREGQDVRFLVPDAVRNYLLQQGIYAT